MPALQLLNGVQTNMRMSLVSFVALTSLAAYCLMMAATHQAAFLKLDGNVYLHEGKWRLDKEEPKEIKDQCYTVSADIDLIRANVVYHYFSENQSSPGKVCITDWNRKMDAVESLPEDKRKQELDRIRAKLRKERNKTMHDPYNRKEVKIYWRMPFEPKGDHGQYQSAVRTQLWWFRVLTALQYATANWAAVCFSLATLFLVWTSRPSMNVFAPMMLLVLGALLATASGVLSEFVIDTAEFNVPAPGNDKVKKNPTDATLCEALVQFVSRDLQPSFGHSGIERPRVDRCEVRIPTDRPQFKIWLALGLVVVAIGLNIWRIKRGNLNFFSPAIDEVAHLRGAQVQYMANDSPISGAQTVRKRAPLL